MATTTLTTSAPATTNGTTHLQSPERITADNVQRLFPDVNTSIIGARSSTRGDSDLAGYDEEQIRLMEEVCIVLDEDDKPIGSASKKICHLMSNINQGLLHRAFSVFLFDPVEHKLLLQQRASEKITFPDMWTNTCCSHPLGVPGEVGSNLDESVMGVRRAAQRKLDQELGIPKGDVPLEKFDFLTRIHYLAPSDGKWGEHESKFTHPKPTFRLLHKALLTDHFFHRTVDYILFIVASPTVTPNPNEVRDTKWVSPEELQALFEDKSLKYTPWFRLICENMLYPWWSKLRNGQLDSVKNETGIRRML